MYIDIYVIFGSNEKNKTYIRNMSDCDRGQKETKMIWVKKVVN